MKDTARNPPKDDEEYEYSFVLQACTFGVRCSQGKGLAFGGLRDSGSSETFHHSLDDLRYGFPVVDSKCI